MGVQYSSLNQRQNAIMPSHFKSAEKKELFVGILAGIARSHGLSLPYHCTVYCRGGCSEIQLHRSKMALLAGCSRCHVAPVTTNETKSISKFKNLNSSHLVLLQRFLRFETPHTRRNTFITKRKNKQQKQPLYQLSIRPSFPSPRTQHAPCRRKWSGIGSKNNQIGSFWREHVLPYSSSLILC